MRPSRALGLLLLLETCRAPVEPRTLAAITQVAVDTDRYATQACALTESGRGFCWGINSFGQLGTEPHDGRTVTPVLE